MRSRRLVILWAIVGSLVWLSGCAGQSGDGKVIVTLWHQMTPGERKVLNDRIQAFESANPNIEIRALYKETEELRSGFQNSSLSPRCPELIYGPSDSMGTFQQMGLVQDLGPWFDSAELDGFLPAALTYLPPADASRAMRSSVDSMRSGIQRDLVQVGDRIGNHLALIYNRKLVKAPPKTTDELIQIAKSQTIDANGDGRNEQYGLVWNYTEPFFAIPFLSGYGSWVFAEKSETQPELNHPGAVKAYELILALRDEHKVIPRNCDYEAADTLFKSGKAAMIINGDWSFNEYLANDTIDAAVAVLPTVSETGTPMGPMVASKGYSLSAKARGEQANSAMAFVRYMTSVETQRLFMKELKTLPSRVALLDDPMLKEDVTLAASARQAKNGRAMPVVPELRAVWDSMRPPYQALLGGSVTAEEAADEMQSAAIATITLMNEDLQPTAAAGGLRILGGLILAALLLWQRKSFVAFFRDLRHNSLAYAMVLPALLLIFATIVYPFIYNIVLSFSNMSLRHFQDWQIVGFQNYARVFQDESFLPVLGKTFVWTFVNVFFHVTIGLLLAVTLNGPVRGKSVYRVLLILPWAVPAYITALTWRGMFDFDYGAINLIASQWLRLPMVEWLNNPFNAFVDCILTNVWLGFPFMMVIALGGMQGIPRELYEAASIDRVSRWGQFWHITLPMLMPVLLPAITLGIVWTFNNLNVIWLVSNGGMPSDQTHILVSYVYKAVFNLYLYGYGAALSMVIFAILLTFSLLFLWRTNATEGV